MLYEVITRTCLPDICRLPWRQGRGNHLRCAPGIAPLADTYLLRHLSHSAAHKRLRISQLNDGGVNVPRAPGDAFRNNFV